MGGQRETRERQSGADHLQRFRGRQGSLSSQFVSSHLSPTGGGLRAEWAFQRASSEVGCNPRVGRQGWDASLRGSLAEKVQSSDMDLRTDAQGS